MVSYPASEWRRGGGPKTAKTGTDIFGFDAPHSASLHRGLVWYLPVSGPPINGKTFPGCFQRVPGEKQRSPPFAFRKATHPSVFVPLHYSRVAARNCLCISESLIVCATSDYVIYLKYSYRYIPVAFVLKIHSLQSSPFFRKFRYHCATKIIGLRNKLSDGFFRSVFHLKCNL